MLEGFEEYFTENEISENEKQWTLKSYPPSIEYTNAEQRAEAAEKFFTDILKIDKVEILKNLTKEEIINKMDEILIEAV